MNHPIITKMLSDERIRAYTAHASRADAIERSTRRRERTITRWLSTALTNLLHARSTSTSASRTPCCTAT